MCNCVVAPPWEGFRSKCGYVSSRGRNHRIHRRVKGAFRWPACTHRYGVYSIEHMFRLSDPFIYNCLDAVGSVRCPENIACVRARCLLIITRFSFKQSASLVIQFSLGLPLFIPDLATTCPSFHARWMFCCLFALHFLIRLSDDPPRGDNGLPDKRVSSPVMPELQQCCIVGRRGLHHHSWLQIT